MKCHHQVLTPCMKERISIAMNMASTQLFHKGIHCCIDWFGLGSAGVWYFNWRRHKHVWDCTIMDNSCNCLQWFQSRCLLDGDRPPFGDCGIWEARLPVSGAKLSKHTPSCGAYMLKLSHEGFDRNQIRVTNDLNRKVSKEWRFWQTAPIEH